MDYTPPPKPAVEIQELVYHGEFIKEANLAQYKGSDFLNAVRVERGISVEEAFDIADIDPDVDYFFYVKGEEMILELPPNVVFNPDEDPLGLVSEVEYVNHEGEHVKGLCRVFHKGDALFFSHEGRWLGSAPGLADVYSKAMHAN